MSQYFEVSATETKNLVRINIVMYIIASQVGNVLHFEIKYCVEQETT